MLSDCTVFIRNTIFLNESPIFRPASTCLHRALVVCDFTNLQPNPSTSIYVKSHTTKSFHQYLCQVAHNQCRIQACRSGSKRRYPFQNVAPKKVSPAALSSLLQTDRDTDGEAERVSVKTMEDKWTMFDLIHPNEVYKALRQFVEEHREPPK